jgi:hypothetical protein
MSAWFESYWYLLAGALIAGVGALCTWLAFRQTPKHGSRPVLSYLLIWPLIFEAERTAKKKTRFSFVVLGFAVMLLLVIAGILLNPRSR